MPSPTRWLDNGSEIVPLRDTVNLVGFTIADNVASGRTDITIATSTVAGAGLTYTAGVLAVGAGSGITVNANDVALASTAAGAGLTYTAGVLDVVATDATITVGANSLGVGAASLTGAHAAVMANNALTPGLPVIFEFTIPAGTTGNVDFVIVPKVRINRVWLVKTTAAGGGAGTIQLANGATTNYITDAMSINVNDQIVVNAASIDDAYYTLAAGATLRFVRTRTASSDESCLAYVQGIITT